MKSGIVGIAALGIAAMALSGCVYPPYGHGYGHGDYHHGPGPVSSGYRPGTGTAWRLHRARRR